MSDAQDAAEEAFRCTSIDNAEDCGNRGCTWEHQPLISPDFYQCTSAALAELIESPTFKETLRCQSLKNAVACSEGGCGWVEVSSDLHECYTNEYAKVWGEPAFQEISRCISFDDPDACDDGGCVWSDFLHICSPVALEKSSKELQHLSYCGSFNEVDECCQATDFPCVMVKLGNSAVCTSDGSNTEFLGENVCDGGSDVDVASGSGNTDAAGGSGSPSSSGPLPVSSSNNSSSGNARWTGGVFVGGVFVGLALTIATMVFVSRFTKQGGRGKRSSDSTTVCHDEKLQIRSIS